ncbi:MAG: basic amino acid ABC transporter substrate-binding protein [Brevinemataceae bacterium]
MKKLLLLCFGFVLLGCGKNDKVIYVGTNAEFPPFEFLEGENVVGFDIEIIQALAKQAGLKIQIENLNWDALLLSLQTKKIDLIISGMTITESRQKIVNFTDSYYTSKEQVILIKTDNTNVIGIQDILDKRVGVILGFTGDTIMTSLISNDIMIQRFNNSFQAVEALRANKIDAVLLDNEPARNFVKNHSDLKMVQGNGTEEYYAIALRKDDTKLLEKLNIALHQIHENGEYQKIYNKYFDK